MLDQVDTSYTEIKETREIRLSPILSELKESLKDKNNKYHNPIFDNTDAIRILAGGTQEFTDENGSVYWGSTTYTGLDTNGLATGGVYRVCAGAIVKKTYENIPCVIGCRHPSDDQPGSCEVMGKELSLLGIPEENILTDINNFDTIGEILKLIELANEKKWKNIVCITNGYHIPRINEIIDNLEWLVFDRERTTGLIEGLKKLSNGEINISVLSAEDIIREYDPVYCTNYVDRYCSNEMMEKRFKKEQEGINKLKNGGYDRFDVMIGDRRTLKRGNIN